MGFLGFGKKEDMNDAALQERMKKLENEEVEEEENSIDNLYYITSKKYAWFNHDEIDSNEGVVETIEKIENDGYFYLLTFDNSLVFKRGDEK